MAVVIRLARMGTKHEPKYRITVSDSRRYVTQQVPRCIGHLQSDSTWTRQTR